jgi:hypothetical protein
VPACNSDTPVSTMSPMAPLDLTVGVKFSRTPYSLNVVLIAPLESRVLIGNSPPTRNDACSPDMAVSTGWASRRSALRFSSRLEGGVDLHVAHREAARTGERGRIAIRRAVEAQGHIADHRRTRQVDAELLGDIAANFGDGDLQHDLLGAGHVDDIGDIFRAAGKLDGYGVGAVLVLGGGHVAGEDDPIGRKPPSVTVFNADARTGMTRASAASSALPTWEGCSMTRRSSTWMVRPLSSRKKILVSPPGNALHDGASAGAHDGGRHAGAGKR